jgi:hypothetical protein
MWTAWAITVGGLCTGIALLLLRDLMIKRRRCGLPMAAGWVWKSGIAAVAVVFTAELVLPTLARARCHCGSRYASRSNLSQLGKAMGMYAERPNNGGMFPRGARSPTESLWLLYPGYIKDHRVFWRPGDQRALALGKPKIREDGTRPRIPAAYLAATGYEYIAGHCDSDGEAIVAHESFVHRGGRNVLRGNGRVEWMEETAFQGALAAQFGDAKRTGVASKADSGDPGR